MAKRPPFVIEESEVRAMLASSALSMEALLSNLVAPTKALARPPISHFFVGAVGLGASGRVFLGVNLEFEGLPLSNSVHAEQFLVANAAQHGERDLRLVAVSAAPCGHCRQFLQELRGAPDLRILIADAAAETQTLAHFLPHRFGPNDVIAGEFPLVLEPHYNELSLHPPVSDCRPSDHKLGFPKVCALGGHMVENHCEKVRSCTCHTGISIANLRVAALEAANDSHAPYTSCPSGIALLTQNGKIYSGSYMESVAYNPSLPPLQAALVAFVARDGGSYEDIVQAILVEKEGAAVQFAETVQVLLQKISPNCRFEVHYAS